MLGVHDIQILGFDQSGKQADSGDKTQRDNVQLHVKVSKGVNPSDPNINSDHFYVTKVFQTPLSKSKICAMFPLVNRSSCVKPVEPNVNSMQTLVALCWFPWSRSAPCWFWVVLPDRDQQDHQKGEDHLHVGQRIHPERTQDDQLDHLHRGEEVDLPLRHPADVVRGRIGGLDKDMCKYDVVKLHFALYFVLLI